MRIKEVMDLIEFRRMQRETVMLISEKLRKQRHDNIRKEISKFIQQEFK